MIAEQTQPKKRILKIRDNWRAMAEDEKQAWGQTIDARIAATVDEVTCS
ncbi:MAG: hypothetical protein ACLP5O_09145 [Acidimicrobiales bacterium]